MSDYLRKLDKERERNAAANVKYQKSIRNGDLRPSGPVNKKKNARTCLGFLIFLIIAIVVVVAISL